MVAKAVNEDDAGFDLAGWLWLREISPCAVDVVVRVGQTFQVLVYSFTPSSVVCQPSSVVKVAAITRLAKCKNKGR